MTRHERAGIALRVWAAFIAVEFGLKTRPLPRLVRDLGSRGNRSARRIEPAHLGRLVVRCLTVWGRQPRCLVNSLVLFSLLRQQGDSPDLVIGLPGNVLAPDAHAWVEIEGRDVGPSPGRRGHVELARYR